MKDEERPAKQWDKALAMFLSLCSDSTYRHLTHRQLREAVRALKRVTADAEFFIDEKRDVSSHETIRKKL